jgi:hypothetical protein
MILDRMQQSRSAKGQRGERDDALPPVCICRQPPLCEKHPDDRVQRAIEKVLREFDRFSSVRQLYSHLLAEIIQLLVVKHTQEKANCHASPAEPC